MFFWNRILELPLAKPSWSVRFPGSRFLATQIKYNLGNLARSLVFRRWSPSLTLILRRQLSDSFRAFYDLAVSLRYNKQSSSSDSGFSKSSVNWPQKHKTSTKKIHNHNDCNFKCPQVNFFMPTSNLKYLRLCRERKCTTKFPKEQSKQFWLYNALTPWFKHVIIIIYSHFFLPH